MFVECCNISALYLVTFLCAFLLFRFYTKENLHQRTMNSLCRLKGNIKQPSEQLICVIVPRRSLLTLVNSTHNEKLNCPKKLVPTSHFKSKAKSLLRHHFFIDQRELSSLALNLNKSKTTTNTSRTASKELNLFKSNNNPLGNFNFVKCKLSSTMFCDFHS